MKVCFNVYSHLQHLFQLWFVMPSALQKMPLEKWQCFIGPASVFGP